jgi:hypothetical protein
MEVNKENEKEVARATINNMRAPSIKILGNEGRKKRKTKKEEERKKKRRIEKEKRARIFGAWRSGKWIEPSGVHPWNECEERVERERGRERERERHGLFNDNDCA